jgi:hypothetical protein
MKSIRVFSFLVSGVLLLTPACVSNSEFSHDAGSEGGSCGTVCPATSACQNGACEDVAQSLAGLRWELPCTNSGNPCTTTASGASATETLTANIAGTQGTTYNVTLHFRGVVEPRTYVSFQSGGAQGAEPDGGVNPQEFVADSQTPSLSDPENIYALVIGQPPT